MIWSNNYYFLLAGSNHVPTLILVSTMIMEYAVITECACVDYLVVVAN